MKKLVYKVCLLLPIFLGVIGLNYVIDPAHIFHSDIYSEKIANLLLKGSNVNNVANGDQRLTQKYYVAGLTQAPNIIVLGSSRSMQIHANIFKDQTFFNNSVTSGSFQDDVSIYELYCKRNLKPITIIITLDHWILDPTVVASTQALDAEYISGMAHLGYIVNLRTDTGFQDIMELLSPTYLQTSALVVGSMVRHLSFEPTATTARSGVSMMLLSDGSMVYGEAVRSRTVAEINQIAITYAPGALASVERLGESNSLPKAQFETFIKSLQQNNVEVVFYLPPFHPFVYDQLINKDSNKTIVAIQNYFLDFARQNHIVVVGSYNPLDIPCSEADFYDGDHPKESCINRLFQAYTGNN